MNPDHDDPDTDAVTRPLRVDVTRWLIGAASIGVIVFGLLGRTVGSDWWPWDDETVHTELFDVVRSTIAVTGLLGATVAAALAIRRQHATERSVRITAEAQRTAAEAQRVSAEAQVTNVKNLDLAGLRAQHDVHRALRERYAATAEQLGHESLVVRLAGVYAMAALADDWLQLMDSERIGINRHREAQSCISTLCASVRTSSSGDVANLTVVETIMVVIQQHLAEDQHPSWQGREFDFSDAKLKQDISFDGTIFRDCVVRFKAVTLYSGHSLSFQSCKFLSSCLDLDKSFFENGKLTLDKTELVGATISCKEIRFRAGDTESFSGIGLQLKASCLDLSNASFEPDTPADSPTDRKQNLRVNLRSVELLRESTLRLNSASLQQVHLDLDGAKFTDESQVDFFRVELCDSIVSFSNATLRGDLGVVFDHCLLTNTKINFRAASIAWGKLSFAYATIDASHISLDYASIRSMYWIELYGADFQNGSKITLSTPPSDEFPQLIGPDQQKIVTTSWPPSELWEAETSMRWFG